MLNHSSIAQQFDDATLEDLGHQITLLAGQINAGNHRLLKLIARFDTHKGWCGGGTVKSCAHWLNWKCGIALGAAREKVRVAQCLEYLPLIDASFAKGEISYSKVRAITRVATPATDDYLLMIAQYGTATHVEQVVRKYRGVTRKKADTSEQEQAEVRKLVYFQDEDGSWIIHAKLPAEAGSLVVKALEAVAKPIQREKQDLEIAQRKERVQAEESVPAGTFFDKHTLEIDQPENSYEQTKADALVTVAQHFLATCDQTPLYQGLKGSERCQIMLHVDIDTLRKHGCEGYKGERRCNLDDKHWLSPKIARRLSCDATLVTVLEDDKGKVLNIGRRARTIPAAINRALSLRDKTCRVPGCCQSKNLDCHHVRHWVDGGDTSLDNLVRVCRRHHVLLHQGAFNIHVENAEATGEPQLVFTTPAGQKIEANFFPQFPEQPAEEAALQALADAAPDVDARTAQTQWDGVSCDYDTAIYALLRRDESSGDSPPP
ncbi:MAG: DUF222 domain-containing protein [Halioglobus sp.]